MPQYLSQKAVFSSLNEPASVAIPHQKRNYDRRIHGDDVKPLIILAHIMLTIVKIPFFSKKVVGRCYVTRDRILILGTKRGEKKSSFLPIGTCNTTHMSVSRCLNIVTQYYDLANERSLTQRCLVDVWITTNAIVHSQP